MITLIVTLIAANKQASQASESRKEERKEKRDDIQRQVIFDLQAAVQAYTAAIGHELRDIRTSGTAGDEANKESFETRGSMQLQANRLRTKALRDQVLA